MNSQQELLDAINTISGKQDRSFDTPATVLRVEGDTVWVHIDGGADETPVSKTINCEQGQTVQVRISGGSAFLVGNASAPPTDDAVANVAHFVAEQADEKATEAIKSVEAIEQTVEGKVDSGDSGVTSLSSTMYQNANGVNIYNNTLAVGDSYAHIDGNSFDIKQATTAGTIDDSNDTMIASFGQEITVGTRNPSAAVGDYSQVYGFYCSASGDYSHAEGYVVIASGYASHAEGESMNTPGGAVIASGDASHAEGKGTHATEEAAHSEGEGSISSGLASHAEGWNTEAQAQGAHSEGVFSVASARASHAGGLETKAASSAQYVIGKYNVEDSDGIYVFIIGNGGSSNARSDAMRVDWRGNVLIGGEVKNLSGNRKYVAEPSSEGTSGQVLTTDGNGGRSWTTVSGGGISATVVGENLIFSSGATVIGDNLVIA